ncbi:MAG: hypothetical protein DRH04_06495, partial [Deltaproteobacteria bacterium]
MKRWYWIVTLLVVASTLLVSCGPTEEPTAAPTEATTEEATPETGAGTALERALAGEFKGTVVTAFGPF